jgi:hypothetical protein
LLVEMGGSGETLATVQPADQSFTGGEKVRAYTQADGSARFAKSVRPRPYRRTHPVEPLSYALGLPTEISVHNVYTGNIAITKRSQRLSFVGGKTLTLSNYADLRLGNETFGLGASVAITADQQHAFIGAIINGNGANGDGGVNRVQFSPGELTVLPNDLFISSRPASDLRSTWDGRMICGQGFYADEVQDNLLVFDSDGNALGSSMSGPNNGGRNGLAFSGDLF